MRFKLKADCELEGEDIDDIFNQLSEHFRKLSDDEDAGVISVEGFTIKKLDDKY